MGHVSLKSGLAVSLLAFACCGMMRTVMGQEGVAMELPEGVKAVWDVEKAHRESTGTRESICINGLWRWQPAGKAVGQVPSDGWGFFKVPGPWPSSPERDEQTLCANPAWSEEDLGTLTAAWYQREVEIPQDWAGRRIAIRIEHLNSFATVFVDGRNLGELHFPGGELDITPVFRPGARHLLSLHTAAKTLDELIVSDGQTDGRRRAQGRVSRRGLCGDVFLVSTPAGARIDDVKVDPSVRNWQITFDTAL